MEWNERYVIGETPWEKGRETPALQEIGSRVGREVWGMGPVLVPGSGFGHDARWIAEQGVSVLGLDIAELALQGARERTEGDNPRFELGDFFEPDERRYSALFEHTCFCAIDPSLRERYVTAATTWLESGGHLVAVFFPNPDHEGEEGPPFGCTLAELDGLFGKDFELVDEWAPEENYPGREGREWVRIYRKN